MKQIILVAALVLATTSLSAQEATIQLGRKANGFLLPPPAIDVTPCMAINLDPSLKNYNGLARRVQKSGQAVICTQRIPREVKFSALACYVYSTKAEARGPVAWYEEQLWTTTESLTENTLPDGTRQYCWEIINWADHERDFHIGISK
ncbi:hypothetical protein [Bradyrhizobium sp. LTSP885]|uniref:hypothetical protein n=1 Tax=Bradyrhizobium sp. LTSP885 TaxID=1619232 RepID=UPI000B1463A1|nr:hypothetical protein [Bradyrhizobium sp. LTSP885]